MDILAVIAGSRDEQTLGVDFVDYEGIIPGIGTTEMDATENVIDQNVKMHQYSLQEQTRRSYSH